MIQSENCRSAVRAIAELRRVAPLGPRAAEFLLSIERAVNAASVEIEDLQTIAATYRDQPAQIQLPMIYATGTPPLSPTASRFLETLYERKGRYQTRENLAQAVFGHAAEDKSAKLVDVYINRVRTYLRNLSDELTEASLPWQITCAPVQGWRLCQQDSAKPYLVGGGQHPYAPHKPKWMVSPPDICEKPTIEPLPAEYAKLKFSMPEAQVFGGLLSAPNKWISVSSLQDLTTFKTKAAVSGAIGKIRRLTGIRIDCMRACGYRLLQKQA